MKRQERVLLGTFLVATLALLAYGALTESNPDSAGGMPSEANSSAPRPSLLPPLTGAPKASRKTVTVSELLEQTCAPRAETDCECRQRATLAAFDRRAPDVGLKILDGSSEDCRKASLLGLEAEALARNAQNEQALAEARRVLEADPQNPYAFYAKGLAYQQTGKTKEAYEAVRQAVKFERGATAHVLLGLLEYQNKNFDEAEDAFEKALELDPKSTEATFNLAVLNQRRNGYHRAREGYLKTLRIDPTHSDALYNLAILARSIGALGEARHDYEKLRRLVGEDDPRVVRLRDSLGPPDEQGPTREIRVDKTKALTAPKKH